MASSDHTPAIAEAPPPPQPSDAFSQPDEPRLTNGIPAMSQSQKSSGSQLEQPQAKKPKPAKHNTMKRTPDAEGRLALTHRHPDFVLPELPADVHPKPSDFLDEESERRICPGCKSSRSLFCYDCLQVLTDRSKVPSLKLPFHIHILLHGEERRSAATSVHAALLAPGQVTIYEGNRFPAAFDPSVTAVLFPSSKSVPVSELQMERLEHVLLIDSKWKKAKSLIDDPLLKGLPHVRLEPVKTAFWRYHTKNITDEGVSTIEAIYYLCKQRHTKAHGGGSSECHCYDDLLFYFAHIYRRIRKTGES